MEKIRIIPIGFDFLKPLCEGYAEWVDDDSAEFVLCMNGGDVMAARARARELGKLLCWWTIEDPNSFGNALFQQQAKQADIVFTSDRECIPLYHKLLGHDRVYWLPLAANEWLHKPLPLADDATDFVFSGNWYPYGARLWCNETVILPLARAGYSMTIYSYDEPPYPELKGFWRQLIGPPGGPYQSVVPADPKNGGSSCYTTADQYTHGRIVLGANCQRSGMDGIEKTVMTSMRTTEALACGKPFLAAHSDAYEALGIKSGDHLMVSDSPEETLRWLSITAYPPGDQFDRLGKLGCAFVLANHTYGHRLRRIQAAIAGNADPEGWE